MQLMRGNPAYRSKSTRLSPTTEAMAKPAVNQPKAVLLKLDAYIVVDLVTVASREIRYTDKAAWTDLLVGGSY